MMETRGWFLAMKNRWLQILPRHGDWRLNCLLLIYILSIISNGVMKIFPTECSFLFFSSIFTKNPPHNRYGNSERGREPQISTSNRRRAGWASERERTVDCMNAWVTFCPDNQKNPSVPETCWHFITKLHKIPFFHVGFMTETRQSFVLNDISVTQIYSSLTPTSNNCKVERESWAGAGTRDSEILLQF